MDNPVDQSRTRLDRRLLPPPPDLGSVASVSLRRSAHQWLNDAGVAVLGLLLGLLVLAGSLEDFPAEEIRVPRDLLLGLVAAVVLLLYRRRWPVQIALVLAFALFYSSTAMGVGAVALYNVASQRGWRTSVTLGLLNAALVVPLFSLMPDQSTKDYLTSVAVFLLGYTVLIVAGMLARSRRLLVESLRERARQAEEGQRLRVEEARLLERERIAREMHDVLAHRISLLAVHAGALEFHADAPADQRAAAGVIRRSAYEAMEDLREVIHVLRDGSRAEDSERPQPALTDLPALLEEARAAGTPVDLDDRVPDPAEVPARIGRDAYRIVQEGLTNARKHAPGARVTITMDVPGGAGLSLEIHNPIPPGPRPPKPPGAGAGLLGLRERVTLLKGMLEHGVTADDRFRLYAWLPFPVEKP